jgi:hypothetical protein
MYRGATGSLTRLRLGPTGFKQGSPEVPKTVYADPSPIEPQGGPLTREAS